MNCSNWPSAYEVWVQRSDTNHGWRRYSIYESYEQAEATVKRVEGAPLELKIVPLYVAAPDQTDALVAATYMAAADVCEKAMPLHATATGVYVSEKIRALTPADALAKLRELMLEVATRAAFDAVLKGGRSMDDLEAIVDEVLGKRKAK